MKFTTTKEKILDAILIAERITGKKESLPILSCVLLEAGQEISARATNLEAGIEVRVPGDVEEKGSIAAPASVLSQTLRSINNEKIIFKTDSGNLIVESRGTRTLIKAVPHDEFPPISPSTSGSKGISVSRERLMRGIQSVSYAASLSMIRPELGSVYLSIQNDDITCAATDSFRLAEKILKGAVSGDSGEMLIPLKHANEIVYILERVSDDDIRLVADDSQLTVAAGGIRYVSRVIDGNFPDYQEIIPKKFSTEATILKGDFAEMVRKARVFSGSESRVGLHLYPKRKVFTATAQSADVGEMSDTIDGAIEGEDVDINFHIGYLADCLGAIEADSITLGFSGAGKPLVIRGVSDASFTYLVMPLNR